MCMISLTSRNSMSWNDLKTPLFATWKAWWLARHPAEVGEYSWSYLFERGKQIRPRLFCELWRYLCPDREPPVEVAFMVECVHVASLILDDLPWMDNAIERRGLTTLHRMFSVRKALLLVHDVLELAWEVGHSNPLSREMCIGGVAQSQWDEWIRSKANALWRGQFLDLSREGSLEELALLKTGTLFECVTELVAIGTGLDPIFWRGWGQALGILFQWVDDWNDRDEDNAIQQRNAFNESCDTTKARYSILWENVIHGIGQEWWKQPFGAFLYEYFTSIGITGEIGPITSLISLPTLFSMVAPVSTPIVHSSVGSLPVAIMFMNLVRPYLYHSLPIKCDISILWTIPEKDWIRVLEKTEGIQPFLPFIQQCERMILLG